MRSIARVHDRKLQNGHGYQLFEWGESGPKVILMHGWSGRATQFFKIIEALTENGYHVLSIEAPAHGLSRQKQTSMIEFVDAIEDVIDTYGPVDIAIGHSLGGMAVFNAFERKHIDLKKAIIIGTPSGVQSVVRDFCTTVGASEKVGKGILNRIEQNFEVTIEQVSTDYLAGLHNPPGLILHDELDRDADVTNAYAVARSWTNAELVITDGLGHRGILLEESVIKKIIDFLNKH